jgi:hypothetical protein
MLVEGEQWLAQRSKNPLDLSMGSVNHITVYLVDGKRLLETEKKSL